MFRYRYLCITAVIFVLALLICYRIPAVLSRLSPYTQTNPDNPLIKEKIEDGELIKLSGTVISVKEKETYTGKKVNEITVKKVNLQRDNGSSLLLTKRFQTILVTLQKEQTIRIGSTVQISGNLQYFETAGNPGEFNAWSFYSNRGVLFRVNEALITAQSQSYNKISHGLFCLKKNREAVFIKYLSQEDAAIMSGMVFGDKNAIDKDINALFQRNGISHILAISGLHISFIAMGVYYLLRRIPIPLILTAIISELFIILYAIMVGFSSSAFRSVIMISIFLLSKIFKRTYDLLTSLSVACILTILMEPGLIFDCGFLLSFTAIVGMGVLLPVLNKAILPKNKILKNLVSCIAVFFTTLPVLLYFYYEVPIYAILLNLIVIPLSSPLMGLSFILLMIADTIPFLPDAIAAGVTGILYIYKSTCRICEQLMIARSNPGQPSAFLILIYIGILTTAVWILEIRLSVARNIKEQNTKRINQRKKNRKSKNTRNARDRNKVHCNTIVKDQRKQELLLSVYGSIVLIAAVAVLLCNKEKLNRIFILDVGQGDGIVIQNKQGDVYIVDCGSISSTRVGEKRLIPFLKYYGMNEITGIFVTHSDEDHRNGIEELLLSLQEEHIQVESIFLNEDSLLEEGFETIQNAAKENNISVVAIEQGDRILAEEMEFMCLYPEKGQYAAEANDRSLVLMLQCYETEILLTGDSGSECEKEYLEKIDLSGQKFRILKVAHHGSDSSTSKELLEKWKPDMALISCGEKNRYGHPHKEILDRLKKNKIPCLITKDRGCIEIVIKKDRVLYDTFR